MSGQAAEQPRRRLRMSDVVEALLAKGSAEHSSVTIARNAKGEVQLEVVVRTGDTGGVETIGEAAAVAQTVYDELRERYPFGVDLSGGAS